MKKIINTLTVTSLLCASTLMLSGCGGSSSGSSADQESALGLPEGLRLSMLNTTTGAYYGFDSSTETRTDFNKEAASSQDSSIKNLAISGDTSTLGYFFHWPDFREVNGEEQLDMKYLLVRSSYQDGAPIDANQMVHLAHLHDDTLAAHSAEEFRDPPAGSSKANALLRLNSFVTEQFELDTELAAALPAESQLCRSYIDPYLKFEEDHEHEEGEAVDESTEENSEEEHEHHDLMHFALDTNGRIHFFTEEEAGLEQAQGFVQLDGVSSNNIINDCNRTTISRVSEDGILVFIPETQKLYLVDAHGGDFHLHSSWSIADMLPAGETVDLVAVVGEGSEHDHDHE